jgi:pimeloyl-ACP methyl ester carboxylesterase
MRNNMVDKPILHFAHANGFPAGCYNKLLGFLSQDYTVIAIEQMGHNSHYPVDDNWESLTRELIDYVERNAGGSAIIGIGHSLGGILTFLAAYRRPELFKGIIMLDPPLAYGTLAFSLYLAKKLGLMERVKIVAQTKRRRTQWASREEAEAYFKKKSPFNNFDSDCLRDYVRYGTMENKSGVNLCFDVNVETNIFRTTPHNLNFLGNKGIPGSVVVGEYSYISLRSVNKFAEKHALELIRFEGGSHLFPLESPERTATLIKKTISKLEAQR